MRSPAMPFPTELVPDDVFWLSEWMRDTAALESLNELYGRQKDPASVLHYALFTAMGNAWNEANKSLIHARDEGNLLFAHAETTRLTRTEAAP